MSKILDYDKISTVYDRERAAVGVDVIAGLILIHCGKPLKVRLCHIGLNLTILQIKN